MKVVVNGGSRESQDQFIGDLDEITIDESNRELRVHDGSKAGGYSIPNRDSNDARYMGKNPELTGFTFKPSQRGLVVRTGAGAYTFRELTVNGAQLTIDNGSAIDGNPYIGLAGTITSDHSWSGKQTYSQEVTAPNFKGNSQGTHTGPVTGDLTGNSTGNHVGAVDVRGKSLQLDDSQIAMAKIAGLAAALAGAALPTGVVLMWAGSTIPSGWLLCDGTLGTPDLRDKFIVAAGPTRPQHSGGGTNQHTHVITLESAGAHTHAVNVSGTALQTIHMPAHNHGNGATNGNDGVFNHGGISANPFGSRTINDNSGTGSREGLTTTVGGGQEHNHTATTDSGGTHVHAASAANGTHIPPYYALTFIMKG